MSKTKKLWTKNIPSTEKTTHNIEQKTQKEPKDQGAKYFWPHPTISYSALNLFNSCRVCFYLRYFCGVKWPSNYKMNMGTTFQDALNLKYSKSKKSVDLSILEPEDISQFQYLLSKANDFKDIVSIDSEYIVDFDIGIPVKFIPDLLTEHEIVENKYTGGYYNKRMVEKERQGDIYWYGIKRMMDAELPVKYQIFNHKKKTVSIVELKKKIEDVVDTISWMIITIYNIQQCYDDNKWAGPHGRFDCNLGKSCPIKYNYILN